MDNASISKPGSTGSRAPVWAMTVIVIVVLGLSLYSNLARLVRDPSHYKYFPPFHAGVNANNTRFLGAEYYCIAKALVSGRGFSDPFQEPSGPTSWMPPILPFFLAGLSWLCGGNTEEVANSVIAIQDFTLIGTGWLLVFLAGRSGGSSMLVALIFCLFLIHHFRFLFQLTHDCWIVLLILDILLVSLLWARPEQLSQFWAAAWGLFGGVCALISPVVAFVWGVLVGTRFRHRWIWIAIAGATAALVVTPWVIRNYLVFGRFIPVKSNLAFDLYQAQCVGSDGVLNEPVTMQHPFVTNTKAHQIYLREGEKLFLSRKWDQFWEAFHQSPTTFGRRVLNRFLAATFVYYPYRPKLEEDRPLILWFNRILHPLPALGFVALLLGVRRRRLTDLQCVVMSIYGLYLVPYVIISYYERYAVPLIVLKTLLVFWLLDFLWPGFVALGRSGKGSVTPADKPERDLIGEAPS